MEAKNDEQLLAAARTGDGHALEQLLQRHQQRVYRFGMKMCGHPEDAEDVLQDTLLTMARSISDFRGSSSLSTWAYTIARSSCIKKRRKSKFAPQREHSLEQDLTSEVHGLVHPGKTPAEAALGKEIQVALEAAIQALEPEQREVLLLRDVEGLTAAEVSEIVGISVAAVKSKLHRARVRVRELLAPTLGQEPPAAPVSGSCPDVLTMYSKHLEGDIDSDLCRQLERHVAACKRCDETCAALKRTLLHCSQLPVAPVPAPVQEMVRAALRDYLKP